MQSWNRCLIYALTLVWAGIAGAQQTAPVDLIHSLVGTANDGQTFPIAGVPFAMSDWTPQTRSGEPKCITPYYYKDTKIQGFRGSHFISGSCTQDYGSFTVMPLRDAVRLQPEERASTFSHAAEHATAYRYSVDLQDSGIHADLTGTLRCGMMQFRYPADATTATILLQSNLRLGENRVDVDAAHGEITGNNPVFRVYNGNGLPAGFSGYAVLQIDAPVRTFGTFSVGPDRSVGPRSTWMGGNTPVGAYVTVDLPRDHIVRVRVGTSFVSIGEARRNLQSEIPGWSFDQVAQQAKAAWERQLARIQVQGSDANRTIFYTAMYHASIVPRTESDVSGTYPRFADGKHIEHATGWTYYDDFSVWDTFRGVHPLYTIIDPQRDADMVQSLVVKGEQGGFFPIFPAWNSYTSEMIGDHVAAIVADAYVKGIRGFDVDLAWQLVKRNATVTPPHDQYVLGKGRRALGDYDSLGYIPLENPVTDAFHQGEQVSRTLEYAYDAFTVSEFAQALGHTGDAAVFAKRSGDWRNVIDPETRFARGRHRDGTWDSPFDPTKPYHYITEGLPYQYTFFVPQDVPGLIALEGGNAAFVKRLDGLFDGGYYNHGNEPSHHIAYLYDFAGAPEKTQRRVHDALLANYQDGPGGYTGNDDAGQMSAWYILSSLGFYPVTPGTPRYEIGTPHFDRMTINLPGGKAFHITATGAEAGAIYVRSIRLNGKPLNRWYLLHSEIVNGGKLEFVMATTPAPSH
ncbi:GH92 family glycosyl hydrolase [Terriglobus sp.]|uniref:GH92 family glycosyl hydrolase n=1 Tax=Terriglobus sp. TaxID=1889013 RepID=UPI003B00BBC5